MRLTEYRNTKIEITTGYECDNCGSIHLSYKDEDDYEDAYEDEYGFPYKWAQFTSIRERFSEKEYTTYIACSPNCYIALLKRASKDCKGTPSATINGLGLEFVNDLIQTIEK